MRFERTEDKSLKAVGGALVAFGAIIQKSAEISRGAPGVKGAAPVKPVSRGRSRKAQAELFAQQVLNIEISCRAAGAREFP
jgi:hypothetical protein